MSDLRPFTIASGREWLTRVPPGLRSACLAAWILAAAGPRIGAGKAEVRSEGISIVLALDVSSSMLSLDFAPSNRLDVAKHFQQQRSAQNDRRIGRFFGHGGRGDAG